MLWMLIKVNIDALCRDIKRLVGKYKPDSKLNARSKVLLKSLEIVGINDRRS
jgi:hypothetical protein